MNKEIQISPRQIAQAVDNLLDEKIKLQQRIEKAIKYIEENQKEYGSLLDNEKIILGILKGEDDER
jgi:hypothetical protein